MPAGGTRAVTVASALAAAGSAGSAGVAGLAAGPLRDAWTRAWDPLMVAGQRLAAGVLLVCALLLAVAGSWLVLCVAGELVDQCRRLRGLPDRPTVSLRPRAVRSLVALLLGSTFAAPFSATADDHAGPPPALDGLPFPDRLPGVAHEQPHPLVLRVRPGDSLWRLAADRLPPRSSATVVDRAWRHLYSRNRAAVGPEPDLLLPGTVLHVPRRL